MDEQEAIDAAIGERQRRLLGQQRQAPRAMGPGQRPLPRRHGCYAARGLAPKGREIGRGIAQADELAALQIGPDFAQLQADRLAHHLAEGCGVKGAEVDDVVPHGPTMP